MKKLILLILLLPSLAFPMQEEPIGIEMELIYTQKADKTFSLKTTITDEENGDPVVRIPIDFSVTINDQLVSLGKATTNNAGVAELKDANLIELRKLGHYFSFTASFAGNSAFNENETSLEIIDAILTVSMEVVDSVNLISATLSSWNEAGEVIPVEANIKIYVPRLFSLLPVTDMYIDEEGVGEEEFPSDVPGGENGELTIISRLEESEEFGIIELVNQTTWGVKAAALEKKLPRGLWSPDAPLWMVITFIILITGVWFHYWLIIYYLSGIKKLGKEQGDLNYSE